MAIKPEEISAILREQIKNYEQVLDVTETGTVLTVGDGIARVHGLQNVMAGEIIEFASGAVGMAQNLEEDNVGVIILGSTVQLVKVTKLNVQDVSCLFQ